MNESEILQLRHEVQTLRRAHKATRALLCAAIIGIIVMGLATWSKPNPVAASTTDKEGILHVRGLIVDDANGRERLRLGAPLPDPMIHGVRQKRSGVISGLLISDAKGNERGGLVTADKSGEAFLGLDAEDEQQVLFLANPGGGVNLDLSDSKGNEAALTVFPKGPRLMMKKANKIVVDLPAPSK